MDAMLQRRAQRYGWNTAAAFYERSWQALLEPAQTAERLPLIGAFPRRELIMPGV